MGVEVIHGPTSSKIKCLLNFVNVNILTDIYSFRLYYKLCTFNRLEVGSRTFSKLLKPQGRVLLL